VVGVIGCTSSAIILSEIVASTGDNWIGVEGVVKVETLLSIDSEGVGSGDACILVAVS